jgi:formate-dependent nitrite reductase membrane component NrfD
MTSENDPQFSTYKDLIMYYHTSIRNVGLTTAVAFAALGYSRFYRGKSPMYTMGMTAVSILLLVCSVILNLNLYNDIQKYIDLDEYSDIEKWTNINKLFILIHAIALFFGLYTFYRLSTGKSYT